MHSNLFHITSKITSLARSGFLSQARKLFDEMPSRDTIAWNSMLTSYSRLGLHRESLSLFHHHMRLTDSTPDAFTFTATLNACAGLVSHRAGTRLHALVIVLGCQSSLPVNNSLLDMYGKCFDPVSASNVFKEMNYANEVTWCSLLFAHTNSGLFHEASELFRLIPRRIDVAWNIMISAFGQCGEIEFCLDLLRQMRQSLCFPDQFTYSAVINACAESLESGYGYMIHAIVTKTGWSSAMEVKNSILSLYAKLGSLDDTVKVFQSSRMLTQVSWNAIIDAYMKSGDTEKAFFAFQQMPEKNLVSWTSMISGYAQKGCGEEALNLFSYMMISGLLPDDFTLGAALHACSSMASVGHGRMVHGCIVHSGFHTYAYVGNGLVDMYAKCGDLDSSVTAFDDIHNKDVVSLNTMIFALGLHGKGNRALQLYEDTIESGMIKPDKVTFVGLLMTCSHNGLVEKGRMLFQTMSSDHGVSHEVDHVACMVDLLGRAGYLSEAEELARKYKEAVGFSNEALLGACSRHGEVGMGSCLGEELKLLEPRKETSYVLRSNMYSASGRWEEAELVRKAMVEEGLKKPPGCSWIEDYAEDYEANVPFRALQGLGCHVDAVSPTKKRGESCPTAIHDDEGAQVCSEKRGHNFIATANWDDVDVDKYDCLVLPGGRAPELLLSNEKVISMVKEFAAKDKVIGAIGQGKWILAAANALKGKRCAAAYGMKVIVKVAGGEVAVDGEGCVTHGKLVTASGWPALSDFVAQLSDALGLSVAF